MLELGKSEGRGTNAILSPPANNSTCWHAPVILVLQPSSITSVPSKKKMVFSSWRTSRCAGKRPIRENEAGCNAQLRWLAPTRRPAASRSTSCKVNVTTVPLAPYLPGSNPSHRRYAQESTLAGPPSRADYARLIGLSSTPQRIWSTIPAVPFEVPPLPAQGTD